MTIDGSIYSMFYGLYNWVEKSKVPMEKAIVMASLNPAKVLGIEHFKGSISECKDADFVVIDDNFKILTTYIEGDAAYTINDGIEYANMKMYDYLVREYE
jgi:N-acetylglucosamine-6-phosphate deacetylase